MSLTNSETVAEGLIAENARLRAQLAALEAQLENLRINYDDCRHFKKLTERERDEARAQVETLRAALESVVDGSYSDKELRDALAATEPGAGTEK